MLVSGCAHIALPLVPTSQCCITLMQSALARRYYICDKKLLALGWKEEETWEHGLGETIDWYIKTWKEGFGSYWENGNVEAALVPHPTLTGSAATK
jgi:hypothetical protein